MLSLASGLNRWNCGRRARRAVALPIAGAFVGLLLTTTAAQTREPSLRDASLHGDSLAAESAVAILQSANGLLHSPPAVLDAQRRSTPANCDALPASAAASVGELEASIESAWRHDIARASSVARGYDATAPPIRPI